MNRFLGGCRSNRSSNIQLGRVFSAAILLAGSVGASVPGQDHLASAPSELHVYTDARAIQQLSVMEARRAHPVSLRGVITYFDRLDGDLFIQDRTAGIYVFLKGAHTVGSLHPGAEVSLSGVTTPGDFSPCVTNAFIRVIGTTRLPSARRYSMHALLSGKEDGHWAEAEGIVHSAKVDQSRLMLSVSVVGGTVIAVMRTFDPNWARVLVDSEVTLRGAIAQMHNSRRQSIGFRLMVPPGFLQVKNPAPVDSFSVPESSMDSVRAYHHDPELQHRVRIRGIVIGGEPAGNLYLAGPRGNLQVQVHPGCLAKVGDTIDVLGFPDSIEARPALLDSVCRIARSAPQIEPLGRSADQILTAQMQTEPLNEDFASGIRDDMSLIRVNGTLVRHSPGPEGDVLLLESGRTQFIAVLPYRKTRSTPKVDDESQLQIVGVCLVTYDQYRRAESFRVLLRDSSDIVVLKAAPWWNLQNAFRSLLSTALLLLIAILWMARQSVKLRHANGLLQNLSFQDGLTGIANRRKFDETLGSACRQASESSTPVSLLMFDIDYFKALNDRYGHQRGDECLVRIADALKSIPLRASDLVARYGGEEFALILPGCDAEEAVDVAERIRLTVLNLAITNEGSPICQRVSVSTGVATFWPNGKTSPTSLVTVADQALYQSKADGKNRTSHLAQRIEQDENTAHPAELQQTIARRGGTQSIQPLAFSPQRSSK